MFILFNKWVLSERLRIQTSEKLYDLEVDHHGGNEVEEQTNEFFSVRADVKELQKKVSWKTLKVM